MPKVSVVRYQEPGRSVREAVELAEGLAGLKPGARVFVKPNLVFWSDVEPVPKWGMLTTSRVVEDVLVLLKEAGAGPITIGEGIISLRPGDAAAPGRAFETLGYRALERRYGVRVVNLWERPYRAVEVAPGVRLRFSRDLLDSDFVANLAVLKTHAQAVVSLGLKNLKGCLDLTSRKRCHAAGPALNLHALLARLADHVPPGLTLLDGIYTLERGPGFDGKARRSNLLVASPDVFAADKVGAVLLGYAPAEVPHLVAAAQGRPLDLSDLDVRGEDPAALAARHEHAFPYLADGSLPLGLARMGVKGLTYRRYDETICTYCSILNGAILTAIAQAWRGEPWGEVEVLTGKVMAPDPAKRRSILLGQCLALAHRDKIDGEKVVAVKGCPPDVAEVTAALRGAGVMIDPEFLGGLDRLPAWHYRRYQGRPEFEEGFYRVEEDRA